MEDRLKILLKRLLSGVSQCFCDPLGYPLQTCHWTFIETFETDEPEVRILGISARESLSFEYYFIKDFTRLLMTFGFLKQQGN